MPHDFLSDEWQQSPGSPDEPETAEAAAPPPRRPRRRWGLFLFAGALVAMFAAAATFTWWGPKPDPVTAPPTLDAPSSAAAEPTEDSPSDAATPGEETADELPDAGPTLEAVLVRWGTRSAPDDTSWIGDLNGQIAPDAARRADMASCLPLGEAPLTAADVQLEPAADSGPQGWSGVASMTITDDAGAQTPVAVRTSALWDEPTEAWVVTSLQCVSSGGD